MVTLRNFAPKNAEYRIFSTVKFGASVTMEPDSQGSLVHNGIMSPRQKSKHEPAHGGAWVAFNKALCEC